MFLLRAVEDGDLPNGGRDGLGKEGGAEGAVEVDLDEADLLPPLEELVDDLLGGLADGAHRDDDLLRVLRPVVDEGGVGPAGEPGGLGEVLFGDRDDLREVAVLGLPRLEVDVVVLRAAAGHGVGVGVEGPLAELLDLLHREELPPFGLVDELDALYLVGGAEAVEEVEDGDGALDRDEVRDGREVGDLLDGVARDHRRAGLAAGVDVGLVAEDRKGSRSKGPRGDVKDRGKLLADPLVEVRDHEEEALGGGVGGREGPALEGAVDRARGAGLRLHLDHLHRGVEEVLLPLAGEDVDVLRHRGGGSDRVDGRHFAEVVALDGRGGVPVHGHERLLDVRHCCLFVLLCSLEV